MKEFITRFAPSPTGFLHLGHIYSAMFTYEHAKKSNGKMFVRMENIDVDKCSEAFETAILDDLRFFNINFEPFILRQSQRFEFYKNAVQKLQELGVLYPCFCSRGDIRREIQNIKSAPHSSDEPFYPQTCKKLNEAQVKEKISKNIPYSLRLDVKKALEITTKNHKKLIWKDLDKGIFLVNEENTSDMIVSRKIVGVSYHIACVIDDAFQKINLVTRGKDLLPYSNLHRLLQELLSLPVPDYFHHNLAVDNTGKRLAKRDNDTTVRSFINQGLSKDEILKKIILDD